MSAARPSTASGKLPIKRVDSSVAFEELRFRSYPSFTRIVVEAAARLSYLTAAGTSEIRVRLSGLNVAGNFTPRGGLRVVQDATTTPTTPTTTPTTTPASSRST